MYDDNSILLWGKHKYTALKRIPPHWLLANYKNKSCHDKELLEYIEKNIDKIKEGSQNNVPAPAIEFPCTKIVFLTEVEAKRSLKKARESGNEYIPIRAYECPKCSGWHLTSKPIKSKDTERKEILRQLDVCKENERTYNRELTKAIEIIKNATQLKEELAIKISNSMKYSFSLKNKLDEL